jgi:arylsulfatase A-like enzyme
MTVFTGLYPTAHGVESGAGARPLPPGERTLAGILGAVRYRSAGFYGGTNLLPSLGFGTGFDSYEQRDFSSPDDAEYILAWLRDHAHDAPLFLFAQSAHANEPFFPAPADENLFDSQYHGTMVSDREALAKLDSKPRKKGEKKAEAPVTDERLRAMYWGRVKPSSPRDIEHLRALYDAEILELDRALGPFVDEIRRILPRSIIVIFSSHGEAFQEKGPLLHDNLSDDTLRVPLLVLPPGFKGKVEIGSPVSLLDLSPTLLDLLEVPSASSMQGASLMGAMTGTPSELPIYSELTDKGAATLSIDGKKLIAAVKRSPGGATGPCMLDGKFRGRHTESEFESLELYNISADPSNALPLPRSSEEFSVAFHELTRAMEDSCERRMSPIQGAPAQFPQSRG